MTHALLEFLGESPTPHHAVAAMARRLRERGYLQLFERDAWELAAGGRYYVVRGGSSIVAFSTGAAGSLIDTGIRMVGAHTDSPCLKVKPRPEALTNGYLQLGVEVYGGALLHPWFDRDLSLAGRVTCATATRELEHFLIDYAEPVACIPSLAIHLNRDVNNGNPINPQTQLPPVLLRHDGDDKPDLRKMLLAQLEKQYPAIEFEQVLDYELCLYDTQKPALVGWKREFIASARLDNLVSCYAGLSALLDADPELPCLLVCNDHEEVGSQSAIGAQGPFLGTILERCCGDAESLRRTVDRSMLISADNAHGIHPNYGDRHDKNHGPLLNHGPVIKINNNQRYATSSETSARFRRICERAEVPLQHFVTRTDLACGSTIGPLTAAQVGVRTLDVGVPQLAMHSVRELCGAEDIGHLQRALGEYYRTPVLTID